MTEKPSVDSANNASPEFFDEGQLVGVWTTQPLGRMLDYKAPEGGCWLGAFVEVPLGPRKVMGVVWSAGKGDYEYSKIRNVIRALDVPPMRAELREFLEKAGAYTLTDMESMLRSHHVAASHATHVVVRSPATAISMGSSVVLVF